MRATAITKPGVLAFLELVTDCERMCSPERNARLSVSRKARSLTFGWLKASTTIRAGAVNYLVEIVKSRLIEMVIVSAKRQAPSPRWGERTSVPKRLIASPIVQHALCRCIVDVQRGPRGLVGLVGIAKNRV